MPEIITLKLGEFTFTGLEIPNRIPLGGEQKLVNHDLVGGTRIVDAMGNIYAPTRWSGLFLGKEALSRARQLDKTRKQGKTIRLQWSSIGYDVIISEFIYEYESEFRIPYQIVCVIISSDVEPVNVNMAPNADQLLRADIDNAVATCNGLEDTPEVNVSTIKQLCTDLKSKFDSVVSVVRATQSKIKEIKGQIQAVQKQVTMAIATTSNTLKDITTLGGVLPNNSVSTNITNISSRAMATNNTYQLMNISHLVNRVDRNLANTEPYSTKNVTTISTVNANLFILASQYYQDATLWQTIADANGLSSPFIEGEKTLVIPKKAKV